jgi:hypothetical protein
VIHVSGLALGGPMGLLPISCTRKEHLTAFILSVYPGATTGLDISQTMGLSAEWWQFGITRDIILVPVVVVNVAARLPYLARKPPNSVQGGAEQ